MNLSPELKHALEGDRTPKFLTTLDGAGMPNCVPITTIMPFDDDTLVFGEFMMNKSRGNLLECDQVGVTVMTDNFDTWDLSGTFLGFETEGKHVEFINQSRLFRYNAYTSIRSAGRIRVEEVSPKRSMSKGRLLLDYCRLVLLAKFMGGQNGTREVMPCQVAEKFSRMAAIRAIGHRLPDGQARAFCTLACIPATSSRLLVFDPLFNVHAEDLATGQPLAVSVITREPIAYQVKGHYAGKRLGTGVIDLSECYSASPPLCGERLDRFL